MIRYLAVGAFAIVAITACGADAPQATATTAPTSAGAMFDDSYHQAYASHVGAIIAATSTSATAPCKANDAVGCRATMVTFRDAEQGMLDAIGATTPPASWRKFDGTLRQALGLGIAGSNLAIKGIDDNDDTEVSSGSDQIAQSASLIAASTGELPK